VNIDGVKRLAGGLIESAIKDYQKIGIVTF